MSGSATKKETSTVQLEKPNTKTHTFVLRSDQDFLFSLVQVQIHSLNNSFGPKLTLNCSACSKSKVQGQNSRFGPKRNTKVTFNTTHHHPPPTHPHKLFSQKGLCYGFEILHRVNSHNKKLRFILHPSSFSLHPLPYILYTSSFSFIE